MKTMIEMMRLEHGNKIINEGAVKHYLKLRRNVDELYTASVNSKGKEKIRLIKEKEKLSKWTKDFFNSIFS